MAERHIPVGISNGEIFIAELEGKDLRVDYAGKIHFDVIRPVTAEQLEDLRDIDERRDEYKDQWKQAVASDATEDSFEDWLEGVWDEDFDEDDEEDYPGKDDSDCQYLTEKLRKEADDFLRESRGMEVGTWESAGCYPPDHRNNDWRGWDYVFKNATARKIAKEFEDDII